MKSSSAYSRSFFSLSLAVGLAAPFAHGAITFTVPADSPAGGVGTVGILEVTGNGNIGNQDQARASLSTTTGTRTTGLASDINYNDSNSEANFAGGRVFLSNTGTSIDNVSILYRGTIAIPTTGVYTFGVNSDDGFTLAFDNGQSPFTALTFANGAILDSFNSTNNGAFTFFGGRGPADSLASINLTSGAHPFVLIYHEGGVGAGVELFAAPGSQTAFSGGGFQLVGSPTGLQLVPEPSSAILGAFGLAAICIRRRRNF